LAADDWHGAYSWAKAWIGSGGAFIVDPWLAYAASAILHRQPKTAVHSLDLGLKSWIKDERDRAVLRFVRGALVLVHMKDPKTALVDLEVAELPVWLDGSAALTRCRAEAPLSKKCKPSVTAAPDYAGSKSLHATVAPSHAKRKPGARSPIWVEVVDKLKLDGLLG
jgi:hypothetical protein